MSSRNPNEAVIPIIQWLHWIGVALCAGLSAVIFLYTNFQTKNEAAETKIDLDHRLDRIEEKIDFLIHRRSSKQ